MYGIEPGLDFRRPGPRAEGAIARRRSWPSKPVASAIRPSNVADVILPIGALPEIEATLVNLDGRLTSAASRRRLKLRGEARLAGARWRARRRQAPERFEFTDLDCAPSGDGAREPGGRRVRRAAAGGREGLELADASRASTAVDANVRRATGAAGTSAQRRSARGAEPGRCVALGIADGAMAKFATGVGTATLQVALDDRVAQGAATRVESGFGATAPLASVPRRGAPLA